MSMVIGNQNYDFVELEKNTEYKGEYNAEHPTIKLFWKVFHEMSLDQKKKFLCNIIYFYFFSILILNFKYF